MQAILNKLGKHMNQTGNHYSYFIKWNEIAPLCKKWSKNRDPDEKRVNEMCEFYNNGGYIPRLIHLAEINGELICYDGNHRREVFDKCNEKNGVVVDVMFNVEQSDVYEAFENINKSIELPTIYLEEEKDNVKYEIINLVKVYELKYPKFLSTSPNCQRPNFNRDKFTENITQIYNDLNKKYSINQISIVLIKLNEKYANEDICGIHSLILKPKALKKCQLYNFWLFIRKTIPIEHIQQVL